MELPLSECGVQKECGLLRQQLAYTCVNIGGSGGA